MVEMEVNAGAIVLVENSLASVTNGDTSMVAVGGVHTLPAPQLAELRKVITHTRQVGVVLPPPDIRAIIDKTAQFVTKNGGSIHPAWQLCNMTQLFVTAAPGQELAMIL